MLSETLDPTLAFLGLDPHAPELPPEPPLPPMPDWPVDSGWRWAPVECACSDVCSCQQWVPTVAATDFGAAWVAGWTTGTARSWPDESGAPVAPQPATASMALASVQAGWAVPGVYPDCDPVATAAPALQVGGLVAALDDTIALLGMVNPAELPPGQALAEAEALLEVERRLRVQRLARLADVQARGLFELRGYRSANAWLTQTQPDAVAADLTMAKRLPEQPTLDAAVREGTVSLRSAKLVQKALGSCRPYVDRPDGVIDGQDGEELVASCVGNVLDLVCRQHAGLDDDDPLAAELDARLGSIVAEGGSQLFRLERAFVVLAERLPADVLEDALDELVYALLPNLLELAQARAEAKRAFRVEPTPRGWRVSGELTAECGERLITGLAAEARRDPANPMDTDAWEQVRAQADREGRDPFQLLEQQQARQAGDPWEPADGGTDLARSPRSRGERLHDALNRLLERYLSSGQGGTHDKVPVQVTATLSADLIDGQPGALPAKGGSGRPLARSLLRRWWCDAHVTALLMTSRGKPLGIAHTARTLTGLERKAAQVQFDQRCMGIGCCRGRPDPLTLLVPHHLRKYAADGITVLEETLMFCETAHHDIHTGKKTLRLRDGRFVNEDGWVLDP